LDQNTATGPGSIFNRHGGSIFSRREHYYVSEIQKLLSNMDRERKIDSLGRPYVTLQLASTVNKLASLKYLYGNGCSSVQAIEMRAFLKRDDGCKSLARLISMGQTANIETSESIFIVSAIRVMELYRDELIAPPRLRSRSNFDSFALYEIEIGDFRWMDDGGESVLENIRDIPLLTHYDELPHFDSVLDWFTATKPVIDKNQIKQGWAYLEKTSIEWHQQHDALYDAYEELIDEYPSWYCAVAELKEDWLSAVPPGNPYLLVPLTTPHQLFEESKTMHHCVVSYIDDCISGEVRIFSVREASTNQCIATAELSVQSGQWKVVQLKGKHNRELMHRFLVSGDPLTVLLEVLTNWYNAVTSDACLMK